MNSFHVGIRPIGDFCSVRVGGVENATWLVARLSRSFVFKTAEPIGQEKGSSNYTFQVPYKPWLSHSKFEKLLAAISLVKLAKGLE